MKIGIVGCGNVGSASAYACVMRGVGTEIVLHDKFPEFAQAQAEDILHATPFASPVPVRAGGLEDLNNCGIIVISAGVGQKPGETRLDLLRRNADLFNELIPALLDAAPHSILIVASNPVDVMTHMVARIAQDSHGIPAHRIIGSGTILDTARFRALVGAHLTVSSHSVHGYVLGEHGDSEVLQWSGTTVGNTPLFEFAAQVGAPITSDVRARIDDGVRNAAARIIRGKGATWYGIGSGIARIAQAVNDDEHAVISCSSPTEEVMGVRDVSLSLPRIISAHGIENVATPPLDEAEEKALTRSAEILKSAIAEIGF
ncbi:MAG: L-lactate dehydrogenase [Alphaproteobacteria bacterium]|nr:L-lactate dehydrogenase [Alphaproteobacteria bacterium]